jgi:hypothetical protein
MTEDLDHLLGRLAARPPHPRLEAVTASVLDQLTTQPPPRSDNMVLASVVAALVAVGLGVAGGWTQRAEARAAGLDPGWALAPSTLLGGG